MAILWQLGLAASYIQYYSGNTVAAGTCSKLHTILQWQYCCSWDLQQATYNTTVAILLQLGLAASYIQYYSGNIVAASYIQCYSDNTVATGICSKLHTILQWQYCCSWDLQQATYNTTVAILLQQATYNAIVTILLQLGFAASYIQYYSGNTVAAGTCSKLHTYYSGNTVAAGTCSKLHTIL